MLKIRIRPKHRIQKRFSCRREILSGPELVPKTLYALAVVDEPLLLGSAMLASASVGPSLRCRKVQIYLGDHIKRHTEYRAREARDGTTD